MSWIPNPFKSLQLTDDEEAAPNAGGVAGGGSVKEDLSVIGETIGRQLRGVAAFLAPPPAPPASGPVAHDDSSNTRSPTLAGIRNDLGEISGSFKSSLSLLSSSKAVIDISKLASNLLQNNEEEVEEGHLVGITDEVIDFVTDISERPQCWTDFPLPLNDDDFNMSDAQAEHISVMERLVPSLAELQIGLRSDLSDKQFWMIYFILLLPRLNENSLNKLSTPEIVEARSKLLTMLQHKRNLRASDSAHYDIDNSSQADSKFHQKGQGVKQETVIKGTTERHSEEDANTDSIDALRPSQTEDEISFSDLEDDGSEISSSRQYDSLQIAGSSSPDGSSEWVQLNEGGRHWRSGEGQPSSQNRDSEGEESSDWLTIDEVDS